MRHPAHPDSPYPVIEGAGAQISWDQRLRAGGWLALLVVALGVLAALTVGVILVAALVMVSSAVG